jgi:hypothetical protein
MRDMTTGITSALQASNVPYMVLAELDFVEGFVRLTNAGYDFQWNGHTWTGAGNLGTISSIEEGQDMQEYGCTLTLSGIPAGYIAKCLGTGYQGRNATIWIAPLTNDYQILSDPVIIFKGRMDTMPIQLGSQSAIQVTVESKLTDWERPRVRWYTDADQKSEYPNDRGFEYVALMAEKAIYWGVATP